MRNRLPLLLKVVYGLSFVVFAVLIVVAFVRPVASGREYAEVQRSHLLKTDAGWVVQLNISNRESANALYDVKVTLAEKVTVDSIEVQKGGTFTYMYHVHRDAKTGGKVTFTVFKQGAVTPLEDVSYVLE